MAQLGAADRGRPARERRPGQLLDLYLHQLATPASYVRAWAEKYQDHGLIVVGVHTPEFDVEHDLDNVSRAVRELRVSYPVAIGNDYAVWSAFDNHYWPALYSADAGHELVSVDARGAEAPADWDSLRSPENYTGYARTENLASPGGAILGQRHACTAPPQLRRNHWALSGDWTMEQQATTLNAASGRIVYRFHARDLHLVMGPAAPATPVRFRVLLDGQPRAPPRHRRRRPGRRHRHRTPAAPAHPPARPGQRPHLRDHLPRPRRPGLLLHLRLGRETTVPKHPPSPSRPS
jgi:thioredoxin family protein